MLKKRFLIALSAIGISMNAFTQDTRSLSKSIYVELFGASNLIGISYDSRLTSTSHWGYRIGISYFQDGSSLLYSSHSNNGLFFPLEVNYLMGKRTNKLELGLGTSFGLYKENTSFVEDYSSQATIKTQSTSQCTFGYYLFSNIGYRYQASKGFLFRIGISPSFSFKGKHGIKKEPFIYPYIGFGYSF